jgi:pimeloyl-ACP methyl ester carboxylesterase
MIAHKIVGNGPECVLVMHDWFSDASSYDSMLPYLDTNKFKYAFVDLRGYGASKSLTGRFDVAEAAEDVLSLCDAIGFGRFHLVGHSMSGMIAQYVALRAPLRVKCAVAITPVPACGSPAPQDMMNFMIDAATKNEAGAKQVTNIMSGQRCSEKFVAMKAAKWWFCSTPEARVAYLNMFANTDFSKEINGIKTPFLVISGEHDIDGHKVPRMKETFGAWFKDVEIVECKNAAHYVPQETPVYLATQIERFFAKHL